MEYIAFIHKENSDYIVVKMARIVSVVDMGF